MTGADREYSAGRITAIQKAADVGMNDGRVTA